LGTALIITLLLTQQLLLNKVALSSAPESRPNMLLFDIQTNQLDSVKEVARGLDMPVLADVPLVTMRLSTLHGKDVETHRADTTSAIKRWVLRHEYRVTYRDSLTESESLLKGKWVGEVQPGDSIFISLEEGVANDMMVDIGDKLVFNVQGAMLTTYVGSIRKVDWQRVETNFLVVFPNGVLEEAPKFHVMLSRFKDEAQSARFQQAVVRQFPNVSIVDLNLILETIDSVITKVSFVIRFMAFFSIITGLIVLVGSVIISKFQRMQESVLLRTLGASRRQILSINALEYFILGSLAALVGIFIAILASLALAWFSFDTLFAPQFWPLVGAYVAITILTVIIGLSNSRDVVRRPPLEILRKES
jgi:putative ABC transport system permease protein